MDGNGGATALGFDGDCLDPIADAANPKKDYIAIPFAAVTDPAAPPVRHHSLFCRQSLEGKEVECKCWQMNTVNRILLADRIFIFLLLCSHRTWSDYYSCEH